MKPHLGCLRCDKTLSKWVSDDSIVGIKAVVSQQPIRPSLTCGLAGLKSSSTLYWLSLWMLVINPTSHFSFVNLRIRDRFG